MRFKEWLLNEFQHVELPSPMDINGVMTDNIDFRFEDWGKGANPDRGESLIPVMNGGSWTHIDKSFSAPLDDGSYLNVVNKVGQASDISFDQWKTMRSAGTLPEPSDEPAQSVTIDAEPQTDVLNNPHWFRYAICTLGGETVKQPEWDRVGATVGAPVLQPTATPVQIA
jgi:hypothetical protein